MSLEKADIALGKPSRSAADIRGELNHNSTEYAERGISPNMMWLLQYASNMELAAQIAELRAALEKYLETIKA